MRFLRWITARLGGPRAGRAVVVVALVLALPALFAPLVLDDRLPAIKLKAVASSSAARSGVLLGESFVFASPESAPIRREMETGLGAWWPADDFKVAFWRPVTAATHALDHALWPGSSVLMHAHTLLWFLALLLALQALYRRFLAPAVATLALALYAWDDARGMVLSWVANRSALVAGVFGVCAVIAHDRWRRDGWRPGAWVAPLLLAVGLLSAEMALATVGFLFAYALWIDQGPLARRMARLVPYAAIVAAWQLVYSAAGYGVIASGIYTHPLGSPLSYAAKLIERAPILALGQLTPAAADFWGMYPPAVKVAVFMVAIAVLVIVARLAWPRRHAPHGRFWAIGGVLALAPIAATGASDRNLVFVGIGVAPLLAALFAAAVEQASALSGGRRLAVGALAIFNLALAPLMLPAKALTTMGMKRLFAPTDASIPREPEIARRTLVVPWIATEGAIYYSWLEREVAGVPKPGRTRLLATSAGDVSVTRLDSATLRLRPADGFFAGESRQMLRSPSRPFHAGDVVALSDMTATVVETTDDGRPLSVDFRFARPLESPEWLWMTGAPRGLIAWTPPGVGQTVIVKAEL